MMSRRFSSLVLTAAPVLLGFCLLPADGQAQATATPTNTGTYTTSGGYPDPTVYFTITVYDSTPNALIYWNVAGCAGVTGGNDPLSSGESFTLEYQAGSDCNPSGTMYATAPGHTQSETNSIQFP